MGSADNDGPVVVLLEKKSLLSKSESGVRGVSGESSEDEELSALRKLLSMLAKSESEWTESDEDDEVLESTALLWMSGAFRASTFVVDSSVVGNEILARLMVPGVYRTVHDRGRVVASSPRVWPRARRVRFRTSDIVLCRRVKEHFQ